MPEDLILPTDMLDAPASNDAADFVDSLDAAWDNIEAPPESKTPAEPAPKTEEPAKTAATEKSADDLIAEAEKGLEAKASELSKSRLDEIFNQIQSGIDPTTGHYFDDTKRYVDALDISDTERHMIFEGNARRVFPRLDAQLTARRL